MSDIFSFSPLPMKVHDFVMPVEMAEASLFLRTLYDPQAVLRHFKSADDYLAAAQAEPRFGMFLMEVKTYMESQFGAYKAWRDERGAFSPDNDRHKGLHIHSQEHIYCVNYDHFHPIKPSNHINYEELMHRGGNKLCVGRKMMHKTQEGCRLNRDPDLTYDLHFKWFHKLPKANLAYYVNIESFKQDTVANYDNFFFKMNALHSAYDFKIILEVPQAVIANHPRISGPTEDAHMRAKQASGLNGPDILPDNFQSWSAPQATRKTLLPTPSFSPPAQPMMSSPEGDYLGGNVVSLEDLRPFLPAMARAINEDNTGSKNAMAQTFTKLALYVSLNPVQTQSVMQQPTAPVNINWAQAQPMQHQPQPYAVQPLMSPFNYMSLKDSPSLGHTQVFTNTTFRNRGNSSFAGRQGNIGPSDASLAFHGRRQIAEPNPSYWHSKSGAAERTEGSDAQAGQSSEVVVVEAEMDTFGSESDGHAAQSSVMEAEMLMDTAEGEVPAEEEYEGDYDAEYEGDYEDEQAQQQAVDGQQERQE